jgi:hypothetical protein
MNGKLLAFVLVAAAGLAGCAAGPQGAPFPSGSTRDPAPQEYRHGMFGDLTWNVGKKDSPAAAPATPAAVPAPTASASEMEEFRKWRESTGAAERQEFEEWRAWQEWKRKNPK